MTIAEHVRNLLYLDISARRGCGGRGGELDVARRWLRDTGVTGVHEAQPITGRADHLAVAHVVGSGLTGSCGLILDLAITGLGVMVSLAAAVAAAVLTLEAAVRTGPGLAAGGRLRILAPLSLEQSLDKRNLLFVQYKIIFFCILPASNPSDLQ